MARQQEAATGENKGVDATRQRIAVAAYACVRRHGMRRVTVEDVAREAGVSRPTVYAYYAGRDALIDAALRWNGHLIRVELDKKLAKAPTFVDKVAVAAAYGVSSDPLHLVENDPESRALLLTIYVEPWIERATEFWRSYVAEAQAAGEVRAELDEAMTARWIARSLFSLSLISPRPPDRSNLRDIDVWARIYIAGGLTYLPQRPPAD